MSSDIGQVLAAVIQQLLRPLVRLLLRHGVAFDQFAEQAKRVYVEVGMREFQIPGRKPSVSRVSIISGLTRKEVQRIVNLPKKPNDESASRYNRAARVIAGWVRAKRFTDAHGEPLCLPFEGGESGGFTALVKEFSGDAPARALLDELLRVGAVERLKDDRIRLVSRAYVPQASDVDKLAILGSDVADLISTIDHNLQRGKSAPYFQRKVMYDNLPYEAAARFRDLSRDDAQALIERFDRWLAEHDRDTKPGINGPGRMRVGVGIYYFEEQLQ